MIVKAPRRTIIFGLILGLALVYFGISSFLEFVSEPESEVSGTMIDPGGAGSHGPQRFLATTEPQPESEVATNPDAEAVATPVEAVVGPSPILQVTSPLGQPIAGARVLWRDDGRPTSLAYAEIDYVIQTGHWQLESYGIRAGRTDEHGCLALTDCRGDLEVWADSPGYSCRWSRDLAQHELRKGLVVVQLFKDLTLQVQLHSAQGQNLTGIPVGFFRRVRGGNSADLISHAQSDESGSLSLIGPAEAYALPEYDYFIALLFPLAEVVELLVDPFRDLETTYELQVPPFGAMRMRVQEADQGRLHLGQLIQIFPAANDRPRAFEFETFGVLAPYEAGGFVVFRPIGLGISLSLEGTDDEEYLPALPFPSGKSPDILGPTAVDEILDFDCHAGPTEHRIKFRVLNQAGVALPRTAVTIQSLDGYLDEAIMTGQIFLDAEARGSFGISTALVIDTEDPEWSPKLSIQLAHDPHRADDRPRFVYELPPQPWPEVVDLGDILLAEPPLLAAGRVLNQQGEPIPFAYLEWSSVGASCELPQSNYWTVTCDFAGRFSLGRWPSDWVEDDLFEHLSEPDAELEAVAMGLWAWAPGYQLRFQALPELPQAGIEMRLQPSTPVELEIQMDSSMQVDLLFLEFTGMATAAWIEQAGATLTHPPEGFTRTIESSLMRLDNLGPGALQVQVRSRVHRSVELLRANYLIEAAASSSPQRLVLDLRGATRFSELTVVTEAGEALNSGSLRWRDPDDLESDFVYHEDLDHGGRLALPADLLRRDCVLVCDGFIAKRFLTAPPSGRVVMKRSKPMSLVVSVGEAGRIDGNHYLYITHPLLGEFSVEASGPQATFYCPEPGLYNFQLFNRDSWESLNSLDVEIRGDEQKLSLHFLEDE